HRAAFRLLRLANEAHVGLFRGPAALLDVAAHAGTDDVFPGARAAAAARHDVIETQFRGRVLLAAVLALVIVAGKDIAPVELYRLLRQLVVAEQANDPRRLNLAIDGSNPVVVFLAEVTSAVFAHLAPGGEVVGREVTVLQVHHLGQVLAQQRKGTAN